jgi:hypothetical protein
VHSWSTFDARTNHGQTRIHKTHHSLDLGEATTFPLLIYPCLSTKPTSKWHFVSGLPNGSLEIPKVGTPCRNPSFGLATKVKGLQGCGPKGSLKVTSGTPGSVGKCEGVNPHTPKAIPTLGDGVPVDSQNFRDRFEGSNLNGLWRSLYQWKALEA